MGNTLMASVFIGHNGIDDITDNSPCWAQLVHACVLVRLLGHKLCSRYWEHRASCGFLLLSAIDWRQPVPRQYDIRTCRHD